MRRDPEVRLRKLVHTAVATITVLGAIAFGGVEAASASAPPNRLDRNLGFVLPSPRIHNLFWDANWNAHNGAFTTTAIDAFTTELTSNGYLGPLAQYGVTNATFAGATLANSACFSTRAPNSLNTATLIAWVACELTNPFSGVPGPVARSPVSDDLYVLYLPGNTTISDNFTIPQFTLLGHTFGPFTIFSGGTSCVDYGADHIIMPTLGTFIQLAIIPTRCAASMGGITQLVSHEVVESSVDAVPGAGFIDDSIPLASRFSKGEAGDICSSVGAVPAEPVQISNGSLFSPYWSNSLNTCVPTTFRLLPPPQLNFRVGKFRLRPAKRKVHTGATTPLRLTWTAPNRWRDLNVVELQLVEHNRLRGIVRFRNDGSASGKLGLGLATGGPGAHRVLKSGPVSLLLARSSVHGSGAAGKTVTLNLALRFGRALAGHKLTLEIGATDVHDAVQPLRRAGTIAISR
jgi:hypothetical protein